MLDSRVHQHLQPRANPLDAIEGAKCVTSDQCLPERQFFELYPSFDI